MGKKLNLIGQKYNLLTVLEETEQRDNSGCVLWKCQCDCGNITYASSNSLRTNHKRSCGCLNIKQVKALGKSNLIDLTGQKFGKLTVLNRVEGMTNSDRRVFWNCQCDCGNTYIANGHSLKDGSLQSCGCLKSVGEQKVAELLSLNGIYYEREKIFSDFPRLRFDFYVQNRYIIEYDGKQHFQDYSWGSTEHTLEESQKKDKIKNDYCFSNNIPIIRIPYTHLKNISIEDLVLETSNFIVKEEQE